MYGIEYTSNWNGGEGLGAPLRLLADIAAEELYAAMVEADAFLERELKDRVPTATGLGRASITSYEQKLPAGAIGVVGSPMMHLAYVDLGTKPHFPPLQPLEDWVRLKLDVPEEQVRSVAFLIARKISKRGTEGKFFVEQAFTFARPQLDKMFERARDNTVRRSAGKS